MLVNRAFTGPRGPSDEAFTIQTPPSVLRILLIVPIVKKSIEIVLTSLVIIKNMNRMKLIKKSEPKEKLKALNFLSTTRCLL